MKRILIIVALCSALSLSAAQRPPDAAAAGCGASVMSDSERISAALGRAAGLHSPYFHSSGRTVLLPESPAGSPPATVGHPPSSRRTRPLLAPLKSRGSAPAACTGVGSAAPVGACGTAHVPYNPAKEDARFLDTVFLKLHRVVTVAGYGTGALSPRRGSADDKRLSEGPRGAHAADGSEEVATTVATQEEWRTAVTKWLIKALGGYAKDNRLHRGQVKSLLAVLKARVDRWIPAFGAKEGVPQPDRAVVAKATTLLLILEGIDF